MQKDEDYRTKDSLTGKWSDINKQCQMFNSTYNRLKDSWGSGKSDADIITGALNEYQSIRGSFLYMNCWEILRGHSKWEENPGSDKRSTRAPKKSKTSTTIDLESQSSDGRNFDLNLSEEESDNDLHHELPRPPAGGSTKGRNPPPPPRPSTIPSIWRPSARGFKACTILVSNA
jgi:hypothetical protein